MFSLKEHNERMTPIWANLEKCRSVLDDLERHVKELEDALRRDLRKP